jgi:hypothetical protein
MILATAEKSPPTKTLLAITAMAETLPVGCGFQIASAKGLLVLNLAKALRPCPPIFWKSPAA